MARALDVVGDRWNLLIVRNLLLGPQSWSELRAGLPGIAKNLLADRLRELAEDGLVYHDEASYGLTDVGRELEPVVFGLANWGERHLMGPPHEEDVVRLGYLMTSIRRKLRPTAERHTLQLTVDGDPFWVELGAEPSVRQGVAAADVRLHCELGGIRALLFGGASLDELTAQGLVAIDGAHETVQAFRAALKK